MRDIRELAERLRDYPPSVDEVQRLRMEKAILRGELREEELALPQRKLPWVVVASMGIAAVALLAWSIDWSSPGRMAQVEVFQDAVSVRTSSLSDGAQVVTAEDQLLRVAFGPDETRSTLVEVSPSSDVRFDSVQGRAHHMNLTRGVVRVEFHPRVRGEERMVVETIDAQVVVVGTIFEVEVAEDGTRVRVVEGVVRVEASGAGQSVRAGEEAFVPRGGQARLVTRTDEPSEVVADNGEEVGPVALASGEETLPAASESVPQRHVARAARTPVSESDDETAPEEEPEPIIEEMEEAPNGEGETVTEEESPSGMIATSFSEGAEGLGVQAPDLDPDDAVDEAIDSARNERGELQPEAVLALAREWVEGRRYGGARHMLYMVARQAGPRSPLHARAWVLVADSYQQEGDLSRAIEAYRRAAVGQSSHASNALFTLARLRVATGQREAGRAAYVEYLRRYPEGRMARSARHALCRLGRTAYCPR